MTSGAATPSGYYITERYPVSECALYLGIKKTPILVLLHVTYLERVVAVIPSVSVLGRGEIVCEGILWRDRALRDPVYAIHLVRAKLPDAVPMDRCPIVQVEICDVDDDLVSPARFE